MSRKPTFVTPHPSVSTAAANVVRQMRTVDTHHVPRQGLRGPGNLNAAPDILQDLEVVANMLPDLVPEAGTVGDSRDSMAMAK